MKIKKRRENYLSVFYLKRVCRRGLLVKKGMVKAIEKREKKIIFPH